MGGRRDAVSGRRLHLRLLTQAGNATALVWLALVLSQGAVMFDPVSPSGQVVPVGPAVAPTAFWSGSEPARRVLWVVVDALRVDVAADRRVMPRLGSLAREGGWGTARVEAPLPSTIAGLRTLVEGVVPPPASFLEDFRAWPAPRGGVLAALAAAGGGSFAAGPRLWSDLYGHWIDRVVTVPTVHGDDRRVELAAAAALRDPGLRLLVVHFGETDDAAHRSGARGLEPAWAPVSGRPAPRAGGRASPGAGVAGNAYLEAVAWADAAIGRLAAAAGPETAVLVTSDHGVTERGGHAGAEPEVLAVPVVTAGPGMPRGPLGALRQRDLHLLVRGALGVRAAPGEAPAQVAARVFGGKASGEIERAPGLPGSGGLSPQLAGPPERTALAGLGGDAAGGRLAMMGLAMAAAVVHLGAAWTGRVRVWGPLVLDLSFWTALALLLIGWRGAALGLVAGALGIGALAVRRSGPFGLWSARPGGAKALGRDLGPEAGKPFPSYLIFGALAAGVFTGIGRLADGALTARGALPPGWDGGFALLAACGLATLAGRWLGGRIPAGRGWALAVGVAAALVPTLCARLAGETVSLSTLDVRLAFRLADGPLGLSGGAAAATLRAVLPALALTAGLAPALRRAGATNAGRFHAGLGAGLCGQALAAALALAAWPGDTVAVALSTGLMVRLFGEISFLYLGCAAGAAFVPGRAAGAALARSS